MKKLLFIFLLSFAFFGCEKKEILKDGNRHLPRETTKGRGIFACYIDDETYIAKRQEPVVYNATTGYLFLQSRINTSFEFRLFIYEGVFGEGTYTFDDTEEEWVSSDYKHFFGLKEGGVNTIEITRLDVNEKIIAGRFSMELEDEENTIKIIKDGRFDLQMEVHY